MTRSPQEPTARAERAGTEGPAPWAPLFDAMYGDRCIEPPMTDHAEHVLSALEAAGYALVPAAATERLVSIEQVSDALNSELDDTDGGNDLVHAVLERLARSEGSGAEPAAMSLLDRDTYNRLAGSAEPDGGGA